MPYSIRVTLPTAERKTLERLCRDITRPALSDERIRVNAAGQVEWVIAAILERAVIGKILRHLGLDPQPPRRGKAREAVHEFAA